MPRNSVSSGSSRRSGKSRPGKAQAQSAASSKQSKTGSTRSALSSSNSSTQQLSIGGKNDKPASSTMLVLDELDDELLEASGDESVESVDLSSDEDTKKDKETLNPTGGASTARSRVLKTGVSFVKKRAPSLDSGAVIPPDADKTPTPRTVESSKASEPDEEGTGKVAEKEAIELGIIQSKDELYAGQLPTPGHKKRVLSGVVLWIDGSQYQGHWKNDQPSEWGVYTYASGNKYHGQYLVGKRHGLGRFMWSKTGEVYIGQWCQDQRHGFGVYNWQDGAVYEGEWKDGLREGYGCFFWPDGTRYEGQLRAGRREGWGIMTDGNQVRYRGRWEQGRLATMVDYTTPECLTAVETASNCASKAWNVSLQLPEIAQNAERAAMAASHMQDLALADRSQKALVRAFYDTGDAKKAALKKAISTNKIAQEMQGYLVHWENLARDSVYMATRTGTDSVGDGFSNAHQESIRASQQGSLISRTPSYRSECNRSEMDLPL